MIEHWLSECNSGHKCCLGFTGDFMCTRLLRAGSAREPTRLVLSPEQREPYVALSYCWGGSHGLKLVQEDLQELLAQIGESETNREAVDVARRRGIGYI